MVSQAAHLCAVAGRLANEQCFDKLRALLHTNPCHSRRSNRLVARVYEHQRENTYELIPVIWS
eukprot:SAG31_NODE_2465_length_5655_cov_2.338553_7_plen_63_part_00